VDSILTRLGVVTLLLLANAFFVAAEFALVASRRTRIEAMIRRGDAKAKLAKQLLRALDRYISPPSSASRSRASAWDGSASPRSRGRSRGRSSSSRPAGWCFTPRRGLGVAFAILTFLHIVLGELTPRALALIYPENTSRGSRRR